MDDNLTHIHVKLKRKKHACQICRYLWPECKHSFSDTFNISPSYKTISYSSIMKIMELLKKTNLTFKNVSELTVISESSVTRIFLISIATLLEEDSQKFYV